MALQTILIILLLTELSFILIGIYLFLNENDNFRFSEFVLFILPAIIVSNCCVLSSIFVTPPR